MIRKTILASAAAAFATASLAGPLSAQATPARVPAEMSSEAEPLVGLIWQYVLFPLVIAAILGLVGLGDDEPASP